MQGLTIQNQTLIRIDSSLLETITAIKTGRPELIDTWSEVAFGDLSASDLVQQIKESLKGVYIRETENDIVLNLMGLDPDIDTMVLEAYKGQRKPNFTNFTQPTS